MRSIVETALAVAMLETAAVLIGGYFLGIWG